MATRLAVAELERIVGMIRSGTITFTHSLFLTCLIALATMPAKSIHGRRPD